jgi:hypothetical protein
VNFQLYLFKDSSTSGQIVRRSAPDLGTRLEEIREQGEEKSNSEDFCRKTVLPIIRLLAIIKGSLNVSSVINHI